jgi:hypothetical protein
MRLYLGKGVIMNFRNHLKRWEDLVTTHEATRAGFIAIAFEKNIKASPFVEEAKSLKAYLMRVKTPKELLKKQDIYPALLTAAGLSDKSLNHLTEEDKKTAITTLIEKFLEPAGNDFVDELIYRFLLTKGDTLGGMMRNIAGIIGEKKFIRGIISSLALKNSKFYYLSKKKDCDWIEGKHTDLNIDEDIKSISWKYRSGWRVLLLNTTTPLVKKNVDIIVLKSRYTEFNKTVIHDHTKYLALGELKCGFDPAGADEHWKTANTALIRIRNSFIQSGTRPMTFFIGAAIENSMAREIYNQLEQGELNNAANSTNENQLKSICHWICEIK